MIAIGAVRIVNGRLLEHECFDRLIKPRRAVQPESQKVHGISPQMLADQPPLEQVLPGFARFAEDTVLIAHNAAFDLRFLEMARKRTGLAFEQPVLDTLLLSPNATTGDSPLGLVNSGEPLSFTNMAACNALPGGCYHGTHVAGIAAGRQSASISPSNLQGIGPDASIISAQVFSYKTTSPQSMTAFGADIFQALVSVLSATTASTINNPYTVNRSIAGGLASTNCNTSSFSINSTVSSLISRGVPVVAATGNNGISPGVGSKTQITWPSCVPQVIKVSSVRNDTTGITLSSFANIANQSNYTGPILLAPGGGDGTNIRSAFPTSTTATGLLSGTSQASPHVAGIYAAVKAANPLGVSVADVTAWIVSTGSIPVTINLPAPTGNQVFRRVRVP